MGAVIRIDILGDSKSAQRSARDANRAYDQLGQGAGRSSKKVDGLGASFGRAAKRYGPLAAAAAGAAVLKLGVDSLRAASDVEQAFGAIDSVFKDNAAEVKGWAKAAAQDVGLAKSEYGDLAAVLGAMLKNTGIEDYSTKTRDLIELGSDLAATFGGTTKDAVESIGSLMRGERDPIEKYGVSIKQADINARLAAEGLTGLTGKTKTQAEQQAALALLFEQTADAQGQFAREGDTLAVSQQKLGAVWENLQATLGERLLPIATRFLTWLTDTITGSNETGEAVRRVGDIFELFLTPVLKGARAAWDEITDSVSDATGENEDMWSILGKVLDAAEDLAPIIGKELGDAIEQTGEIIGIAVDAADALWKSIKKIMEWADKALGPLDELASKMGKVSGLGAGDIFRTVIGGPGALLGGLLFRSDPGALQGLGRDESAMLYGARGTYSQRISVAAAPVHVYLDSTELANSYYRVGRQAARDEISTQVRGRRAA